MSLTLEWHDIALRLALVIVAGAVLGANRSERGRAAGLVTTVLVCLAAAVSMIQTNLLLSIGGKADDSFITLDLMRLPLGILTGMGFIGAGAILRRGRLIRGVTTAATLWLATVIGLCLGGGQIGLGVATTALGLLALWGLKKVELWLGRDHRAIFVVIAADDGPTEQDVRGQLLAARYRITTSSVIHRITQGRPRHTLRYDVEWHARRADEPPPPFLDQLRRRPGVLKLSWKA
jgi:putative Mg2+ transporter-C (MgtC) family protein